MSDPHRLLQALRAQASGRRKLVGADVWAAFRSAIRGTTGDADARPRLAELLDALAAEGSVALPRTRSGWDGTAQPPLPRWLRIVPANAAPTDRPDHRTIPWPPELAFVSRLDRVPLLDDLLAIQRFLGRGGRERSLVPHRERSLQIFGDEKRLDELRRTSLFRTGKLSLELLRCHDVAPPLVWEASAEPAAGRAILVIENLHTYDSFRRYNGRCGRYAAVAYGHGHEFMKTCLDLPRLTERIGAEAVEYFGDLDGAGLQIPHHARQVLRDVSADLALAPATTWYEALLGFADRAVPAKGGAATGLECLDFLPARLRPAAEPLLRRGLRLPQELIGTEFLTRHPGA